MTVSYNTTVKNARLQVVADAIDGGSGAGTLEIGTSGMGVVLATLTLTDPCGSVSGGVLTLDADPDIEATATGTGTAAAAQITDSSGTVVVSGLTVGTSGTDIVIGSTAITSGGIVRLTAGTITHAA